MPEKTRFLRSAIAFPHLASPPARPAGKKTVPNTKSLSSQRDERLNQQCLRGATPLRAMPQLLMLAALLLISGTDGKYALQSIPCRDNGWLFRRIPTDARCGVRLAAHRSIQQLRRYRFSPGPTLCSVRCRLLFLINALLSSTMDAQSIT